MPLKYINFINTHNFYKLYTHLPLHSITNYFPNLNYFFQDKHWKIIKTIKTINQIHLIHTIDELAILKNPT